MKKTLVCAFTKLLLAYLLIGPLTVGELWFFGPALTTSVESDVTEDTIWTLPNSPYEIQNDVKVNAGVTLTIEPGVAVSFADNASLTVEGSLFAAGNDNSRINFTSIQPDPARGQWANIRFAGGSSESFILKFVDVTYAKNGVVIDSLGLAVIENSEIARNSLSGIHAIGATNLLITNNTIEFNAQGISASGTLSSGLQIIGNQIANNEDAIYFDVYGNNSRINDITISNNDLKANSNGIFFHSLAKPTSVPTEGNAYINDVAVVDNSVKTGKYGIYLLAEAWGEPGLLGGGAYIYNSMISRNTVSFNEYALKINSTSNWYSWISDVAISNNKILANKDGISLDAFRTPQPPFKPGPFDTTLAENIISANNNTGINISGDVRANLTGNSVSYNSYGIYITSKDNVARENDIYENSEYGMYVASGRGTIDGQILAEDNYWGASNGPFHESLNLFGEGDEVNGDGENLDFRPFLTVPLGYVNEPPTAKLGVSRATVAINQSVTCDGLNSADDSRVENHLFDFGDGENSGWISIPIIRHRYGSPGLFNVSLVVMDEYGVRSNNIAVRTVRVTFPLLDISVFLDPIFVFSQGEVLVEISITDQETVGVEDALVQLASDAGGTFNPASGHTNSNGRLNSTFLAPKVSVSTGVQITVSVSKDGYENGTDLYYVSVLKTPSNGGSFNLLWIGPIALLAAIVVALAWVIVKRRKRRSLLGKRKSSVRILRLT